LRTDSELHRVSIIIPTYNSGAILERCLKSIQDQSYPFWELILIDNFSADNSVETAKAYGATILLRKCNPAQARNIGIIRSSGEYLLFLDSDQVLSSSLIEECTRLCENGKLGMILIPEVFVGSGFWSTCSAVWKNCYEKVEQLHATSEGLTRGKPRFFLKDNVIRVGMYDPALIWGEDDDLHEKLKKAGVSESYCASKIYHYELTSVKGIIMKNIRYGRSMPKYAQQTRKKLFPSLFSRALLTVREVSGSCEATPTVVVGCVLLLCLKTCAVAAGFLEGLTSRK